MPAPTRLKNRSIGLGLPDAIVEGLIDQAQAANLPSIEHLADETTRTEMQVAIAIKTLKVDIALGEKGLIEIGKFQPMIRNEASHMRAHNASSGLRLSWDISDDTEIWAQVTETQLFRTENPDNLISSVVAEIVAGRTDDDILGNYGDLDSYELGASRRFSLFGTLNKASVAVGSRSDEDEYVVGSIENSWGIRLEAGEDRYKGSSRFDQGKVRHASVTVRRPVFVAFTRGRLQALLEYYRRNSDITQYSSFDKVSGGLIYNGECSKFRRFGCSGYSVSGVVYRAEVEPNTGLPNFSTNGVMLNFRFGVGRSK